MVTCTTPPFRAAVRLNSGVSAQGELVGIREFEENWNALAEAMMQELGLHRSRESHPIVGWLNSARRSYMSGDHALGCAQAAYAQFVIEDLERVKGHDESMFAYFRKELRRNLPPSNYFGVRQELRLAAALLTKGIRFNKSETPDFTLPTSPSIGIECTSVHLSEQSQSKPKVAYKLSSAISKKSSYSYSTELQILAVDTSNLLFHEGLHQSPVLSRKTELREIIAAAVDKSSFQSLLTFSYAWVPAGIGNGATLTNYYSRVDRSDIAEACRTFLDTHYPLGDIWVLGHLHQRV